MARMSDRETMLSTPEERRKAMTMLAAELKRAEEKHPHWPIEDQVHATAVLGEEAGETVKAALQFDYEDGPLEEIRKEAVQTGAMALRVLVGLERFEKRRQIEKAYKIALAYGSQPYLEEKGQDPEVAPVPIPRSWVSLEKALRQAIDTMVAQRSRMRRYGIPHLELNQVIAASYKALGEEENKG